MTLFPADKLTHALVSALLFAVGAFGAKLLYMDNIGQLCIGVMLTIGVGLAKELVWDKWLGRGTPSEGDMWADVVGMCAGILIYAAGAFR